MTPATFLASLVTNMYKTLLKAIFAGCIAGTVVFSVQFFKLIPLILTAETYETGLADHHDTATTAEVEHSHGATHTHDHEAWQPEDGLERYAYTFFSNIGMAIGFALLLMGIWMWRDQTINTTTGLLWGLGGFIAFSLAPSFGLPPELPGTQAAALDDRQVWWLATALATSIGLGMLFLYHHLATKIGGVVFIALPHIIGHPQGPMGGAVPPELNAHFAAASIAVMGLFWVVLGACCGWLYGHFDQKPEVT